MIAAVWVGVLGCSQADVHAPTLDLSADDRERTTHVSLRLCVDDVQAAVHDLRDAIEARGGYVESADSFAGSRERAALVLRVPRTALAELRADIVALGDVEADTEQSTDVTSEHVELTARLTSARAEQARLVALMSDRTASLADVLAVERELSRVTESIEQLEASERALAGGVRMATVNVDLVAVAGGFLDDPFDRLASTAASGVTAAGVLVLGLAVVLVAIGPSVAVLALLALIGRRLLRLLEARPTT